MIEISDYDSAELGWHVTLDGGGDPSDTCGYCSNLIGYPPDMSQHADDCPYTSGLWTIQQAVYEFQCDGCGEEHTVQYCCARCELFFEDGDPYRIIDDETGLLVPWVESPGRGTAICVECAQKQTNALIERLA